MNITNAISKIKKDLDDNKLVFVLLSLRGNGVVKYIDKFLSVKEIDITEEVLDNISIIIEAAKAVYESDYYMDPYSDIYYDKLLSKFKKYRAEPFANNAIGLANATYKYEVLSGTLNKAHFIYNSEKTETDTRDSMEDYMNDIPVDDDTTITVLINHKEDGTSVTVDYKYNSVDGMYYAESAISRGKKDYGEGTDVSTVMPECGFPDKEIKKLFGSCPKYIGIQYEMLVSNKQRLDFEDYSKQKFANNRSAAAGLLRRIVFAGKDERKKLKKYVSLVPVGFDVLDKYANNEYYRQPWDEIYKVICSTFMYGDVYMDYEVVHGTKSEILARFAEIAGKQDMKRPKLNHAIDGLVMTIVDKDIQREMGRSNNINKFQIAYKFSEEIVKTIVRDVEITTGNFGYKEILLIVDPVVLNGTTQFKAQVHSLKRFEKMNLRIGDEILLKLSGDVIPYGYKDDSCRKGDGKKIKLPEYCECGSKLMEEKNKLRCMNPRCSYRIIGSLTNFFTELNVKGIGGKTCAQLYNELGVSKPSDILNLTLDDFKKLKGFKDASAQLCMNTLHDILNKPRTIPAILSALGIDSLRSSTATKMLEVASINEIMDLAKHNERDKLIALIRKADGIDTNAEKIADGLIQSYSELEALIKLIPIRKKEKLNTDKVLLISGLRHDDELEELANKNGYEVKDNGKKFDLLVVKDESLLDKSKSKYAMAHNIPIMTRSEFMKKYSQD